MAAAPIHRSRWRAYVCLAAIVLGACVFVAVPIHQLIVPGPFQWHLQLPSVRQGGIEALVLAALLAAGFALNRRGAWIVLVAIPVALYLRRHAVDVPLLIDLAYLEITIGLGMCVRRALRLEPARTGEDYLHAFVLGFLAWSLAAWTLSALGRGSIVQLRWLTLLLGALACCGRTAPFTAYAWRRMRAQDRSVRVWCGLLAAWILISFARSNVVVGFDSIWYGLRPEQVLDPGRSLFEPLGLVSPVNYFPKLYEAFLLPVSRLRDFSVIDGMTILLLPPILLACLALMRRIATPARAQWPVLALVATLPALANMAIGPKPDVISTLFLLLAALAALDAVHQRSASAGAWMLACAALACLSKLTAIPYAGVLVLAALVSALLRPAVADGFAPRYPALMAATALAMTLVVGVFVTARTWLLAGVPTIGPDPLMSLWRALGMELREPAGTLPWTAPVRWAELPQVTLDVLLRPHHDLPHMIITWIGNVWLWLALIAGIARVVLGARRSSPVSTMPLLALIAVGLYVFFGVGTGVRGSDGNYFLFAVVPAILLSATAAFGRLDGQARLFAAALACLPAFVAFHASYSFVSAGWASGTLTFDGKLNRKWKDAGKTRRHELHAAGIERIGEYLGELPGSPRVVGSTLRSGGYWLPARFESLSQIGFARPEYLANAAAFRRFLAMQGIRYLILPLPGVEMGDEAVPAAAVDAAAELEALTGTKRLEDRQHYLLDFSAVAPAAIDPAAQPAESR